MGVGPLADGDSSFDAVVLDAFAASCGGGRVYGSLARGLQCEEKKLQQKLQDGPSQERGLGSFVLSG